MCGVTRSASATAIELARYQTLAPALETPSQEFADSYDAKISVAMTGATTKGSLDARTIERYVKSNRGALERCYRRALLDDTELHTRITLRFVIGVNRRVSTIASADEPAELVSCVAGAIRAIQFPAGKGSTTVVYPLAFAQ